MCGEKSDVEETVCDDFQTRVPSLTDGYRPGDVFNYDETGPSVTCQEPGC